MSLLIPPSPSVSFSTDASGYWGYLVLPLDKIDKELERIINDDYALKQNVKGKCDDGSFKFMKLRCANNNIYTYRHEIQLPPSSMKYEYFASKFHIAVEKGDTIIPEESEDSMFLTPFFQDNAHVLDTFNAKVDKSIGKMIQVEWPTEWIPLNIAVKELLPLLSVHLPEGATGGENMSCASRTTWRLSMRNPMLMHLLRALFFIEAHFSM